MVRSGAAVQCGGFGGSHRKRGQAGGGHGTPSIGEWVCLLLPPPAKIFGDMVRLRVRNKPHEPRQPGGGIMRSAATEKLLKCGPHKSHPCRACARRGHGIGKPEGGG